MAKATVVEVATLNEAPTAAPTQVLMDADAEMEAMAGDEQMAVMPRRSVKAMPMAAQVAVEEPGAVKTEELMPRWR